MNPLPLETMLDDEEEINRVRQARHRISERFGHDPYRLVAHYMKQQQEHPDKLVPAPESKTSARNTAD
jgi:hypothetical protein